MHPASRFTNVAHGVVAGAPVTLEQPVLAQNSELPRESRGRATRAAFSGKRRRDGLEAKSTVDAMTKTCVWAATLL